MSKLDRYKILIRHLKKIGVIANQRDLGQKMGYNNPSAFSQVINGKTFEPKLFTQKLKGIVPELNLDWLENGIGTMFDNGDGNATEKQLQGNEGEDVVCAGTVHTTAKLVPLLPISAQGGTLNDFVVSVNETDCEKIVSPITAADYAMPVTGESMSPEYPAGSKVFIKRINEKAFIDWGRVYVLDTCNGTVIKRLVPSTKEGYVRCLSINQDPIYAPFDVSLGDVYGIYRVILCMAVK